MPPILLFAVAVCLMLLLFFFVLLPKNKAKVREINYAFRIVEAENKLEQLRQAQEEYEQRLANLEHIVMDSRFSEQDWAPKQPIALKQEIDQLRIIIEELKKK